MSKLEDRIEIANPQQPHCATVLLLDSSGSMSGQKIAALNEGLRVFKEEILGDELASKRVDLAAVTFEQAASRLPHRFLSIEEWEVPVLAATESTPMGRAIISAAQLIEERKEEYKSRGIDYYRPWIFVITDGEPTDMRPGDDLWNEVAAKVREGEASKKFMFFAVGVEPANLEILNLIAPSNRPAIKLKGTKFRELFQWLSKSQSKVSSSRVGEQVALENPVAAGWAEISA